MKFASLAVLAMLLAAASALDGGDVAGHLLIDPLKCAKEHGWGFVIVRSYHSYGAPDTDAIHTLFNAKDAGIPSRGVYHFPCAFGKSAADQVNDDINALGGTGNFDRMWFDIETNPSPGCGWSSDKSRNCKFLGEMIDAGRAKGAAMGVYASPYMWESIMGSCTVGADHGLPLWYAHYDYTRSFGDYTPFGGWRSPALKQYNDKVDIPCGINADADWRP